MIWAKCSKCNHEDWLVNFDFEVDKEPDKYDEMHIIRWCYMSCPSCGQSECLEGYV